MLNFILLALALMLTGIGIVVHFVINAPEGYEDERGFHFAEGQAQPSESFPHALPELSRQV
jgi:hypothetical protein